MVRAPDQSCLRSGRLCNAARRAARIAGVWLVLSLRALVAAERRSTGGLCAPYVRDAPDRLPLRIYGGSGLKTCLDNVMQLASVLQDASSGFSGTGFCATSAAKSVRR